MDQNINYEISEKEDSINISYYNGSNYLEDVLDEFDKIELDQTNDNIFINDDELYTSMNNYEMNYTVKQLQVILEYYGLKNKKMKKEDLIYEISLFEENYENMETVMKRKEMWYYMEELKNDKFMKKFVFGF